MPDTGVAMAPVITHAGSDSEDAQVCAVAVLKAGRFYDGC